MSHIPDLRDVDTALSEPIRATRKRFSYVDKNTKCQQLMMLDVRGHATEVNNGRTWAERTTDFIKNKKPVLER